MSKLTEHKVKSSCWTKTEGCRLDNRQSLIQVLYRVTRKQAKHGILGILTPPKLHLEPHAQQCHPLKIVSLDDGQSREATETWILCASMA